MVEFIWRSLRKLFQAIVFMENKIRVLFLSKYSEKGASSRYRFYNYSSYFESSNISVVYRPLFKDSYLKQLYQGNKIRKFILGIYFILNRIIIILFQAKAFDHIVIEAELFPHIGYRFENFFLRRFRSFSLDFDDNISANYRNTVMKDKIPKLMKLANFVTVGNRWYISEFEGNLIYLPTVIDLDKYPVNDLQNKEISTLVWIGSPSTVKYLKLIEKVLVRLSEKHDFVLKVIGGTIKMNEKIKVQTVSWSSVTENFELASSSIGIMPLENNYWEKGKCGFKLIQYMASGLPVVGSSLPANIEIVNHNVNGFIVGNEDDWFYYLDILLRNESLCREMGGKARARVEQHYSYQVWGEKFVKIIKENV